MFFKFSAIFIQYPGDNLQSYLLTSPMNIGKSYLKIPTVYIFMLVQIQKIEK